MSKAVHLTSVHNPFDNRLFYKECRTLKEAGYDVTLIAPYPSDEVVDGIEIKGVTKYDSKGKRLTKTVYEVYQRASQIEGDIYHLHDPELLPIGFILYLRGKKVIFDMHENVPKSIRSKDWIPAFLRKMVELTYKGIEKIVMKRIAVIYAENSYKEEYQWLSNTETILNLPKVDKLLQINSPENEIYSVGYIGEITKLRGINTILDALSYLKKEDINIRFECVGNGPENEVAEIKSKSQNVDIDTNFYGFKPSIQGLEIISRCHIGLAILKDIPNYRNSYPTKIFEYMALGIPVITSNFPLYRSIVEENECGICVDPDNVSSVANAIKELYTNPEMGKAMGKNGKKVVQEKYTWESQGKKLLDFYEKILSD